MKKWKCSPLRYAIIGGFLLIVSGMLLVFWHRQLPIEYSISLTHEEKNWIEEHDGQILLAPAPNFAPLEFFDSNGVFKGLVADYIRLIEKRLGLHFQIVKIDTWAKILEMARSREIDMFSCGQELPERSEYMDFTTPYIQLPHYIIVHQSIQGDIGLDHLQNRKVAVTRGYSIVGYLKRYYPNVRIHIVENETIGLEAVSLREADAIITTLPNVIDQIERSGFSNLRVGGQTDYSSPLSMATRSDWPIFHRLMQKGLNSISKNEREEIYSRWIRLSADPFYLGRKLLLGMMVVSTIVLTISILMFFLNRTLKRKVDQKTEALQLNEMRLEALLSLSDNSAASTEEIITFTVKEAIRLTGSSFGYIDFMDKKQELPSFIMDHHHDLHRIEKWAVHSSGFPLSTMGLWGEAVRKGSPVISNHYASTNPLGKGLPDSIATVTRYMNVPIISEGQVVAIVGVGNKLKNYDASDDRQLRLLIQGMWRIVLRRKHEAEIKESEENLRNLMARALTGTAILSRGHIVFSNPEMRRIFGSRLALFGSGDCEAVHPGDRESFLKFIRAISDENLIQQDLAFRLVDHSGAQRPVVQWLHCRASAIDYRGRPSILVNIMDLTQPKELEKIVQHQEKLASLGRVAAGIAHEIRNPLSGINIFVDSMADEINEGVEPEDLLPIIEKVRNTSEKIEKVIRRVMDFATPGKPRFQLLQINEPVKAAIALARVTLLKGGIQLKTVFADNLPLVHAEPHQIEEVVLNLINNAAQALHDKVNLKLIHVDTGISLFGVTITVSDNGTGVPKEFRRKVFEPFFTSKAHSTGIGLNLCQRIAVDHGGTLTVGDGALGGAEFTLTLPLPLPPKAEGQPMSISKEFNS